MILIRTRKGEELKAPRYASAATIHNNRLPYSRQYLYLFIIILGDLIAYRGGIINLKIGPIQLTIKGSVGIYGQKLRGYVSLFVSLISHPYNDSLAPYLGTAILMILYFLYLLDKNKSIS